MWQKRHIVENGLDLAEPRRRGAWDELVQNGVPQISVPVFPSSA